jgi:transcriptional regulator with XRE-family HTH domain
MTSMTEARPARLARTAIRRPASGIVIDPAKLTWWRDRRAMSRQDLSDRITVLWLDGHPDALPFTHAGVPADRHAALPPRPVPGSIADPRTCTQCGERISGGLTRDAIAKIENGERRPKARTLRALCAALSTKHETVLPEHLQPGGPPLALSPAAQDRQARKDYNEGMRDFADALGRPELYKNANNRIYYSRDLRDMYERFLAETGAGTGMASAVA